MALKFGNYTDQAGITEDYFRVREFLVKLGYTEFPYARWDWMATHGWLDKSAVGRIGLWEDEHGIVGLATFDTRPGEAFCMARPGYADLKREMLHYAAEHLGRDGEFGVVISDRDAAFQSVAASLGFIATKDKENDAAFYLDETKTDYALPPGYSIASMADAFDLFRYRQVLWKGFNHELKGEGPCPFSAEDEADARAEMVRAHVDLSLKVAVVAPDGNFVSYCGMWYEPAAGFAVIEPVATDPDYRKMGLGKAAVLEGIRRVGALGAKLALVGSAQQFYYSIGLRPYATATVWRRRQP
ncbi:MAG TPA: GNAT family N-acetyltransferase [Clostridia bacterium]|nr:GNAT family N-acetyltransferase [Clostridia bacterium]